MFRPHLWLGLLATLCATQVAAAADGWSQLKNGMKLEEVARLLGKPVLTSQSRGYDLWIYDYGAETIAAKGLLMGWTAPKVPASGVKAAASGLVPPAAKRVAAGTMPEDAAQDVLVEPVVLAAQAAGS